MVFFYEDAFLFFVSSFCLFVCLFLFFFENARIFFRIFFMKKRIVVSFLWLFCIIIFYEKILLGINPTKEHDKTYPAMHYQCINQAERALSVSARVGSIVVVCKTDEKILRAG